MLKKDSRKLYDDEKELLNDVVSRLLPLDLEGTEEILSRWGLIPHFLGWFIGAGFIALIAVVVVYSIIVNVFILSGTTRHYISIGCFAFAIFSGLFVACRKISAHLAKIKVIENYRCNLISQLNEPIDVLRCKSNKGYVLKNPTSNKYMGVQLAPDDTSVLMDLGDNSFFFVRRPLRYGRTGEPENIKIKGNIDREEMAKLAGLPNSEFSAYFLPGSNQCIGIDCFGEYVNPEPLDFDEKQFKQLPADAGVVHLEDGQIQLKSDSKENNETIHSVQEKEEKRKVGLGRGAFIFFIFIGILKLLGMVVNWPRTMTVKELKVELLQENAFDNEITVEGKISNTGVPPVLLFKKNHNLSYYPNVKKERSTRVGYFIIKYGGDEVEIFAPWSKEIQSLKVGDSVSFSGNIEKGTGFQGMGKRNFFIGYEVKVIQQ